MLLNGLDFPRLHEGSDVLKDGFSVGKSGQMMDVCIAAEIEEDAMLSMHTLG